MKKLLNIDDKCKHWRKLHRDKGFVSFRRRIVFELMMNISFYIIVHKLIFSSETFDWGGLVFTSGIFVFYIESVVLFDKFIEKKFPWHEKVKTRTFLLIVFAIIWMLLTKWIAPQIEPYFVSRPIVDLEKYNLTFAFGILYMAIFLIMIIARNFHKSMEYFMVENEKLKQDKILTDYKALQDQVNPHFLFNNLSTLIAIIRTDKEKAIDFAENFTDVYRYLLIEEGQVAISLKEELAFVEAYTTLHKARIGDGLEVEVNVPDDMLNKRLPHLGLQVLVENAIKHNITSRSKPLSVKIGTEDGKLYVINNKQKKESTYSTKTGLSNLGKRLKILTDEEYKITEDEYNFKVEIPLID
ncbi:MULTISPECIES: sensor histidine kinase [unclassified Saccharicrinis]|uniref:sensor histidine kinase n=1 Tax=unclassified Saccharicrinis TaxID=2646859 RepID=UPI003D34D1F7